MKWENMRRGSVALIRLLSVQFVGPRRHPVRRYQAVKKMENLDINLILFVGGDGTDRDIYRATNGNTPFVGVPAGVKIHSGVYAINPACAGEVAVRFLEGSLKNS